VRLSRNRPPRCLPRSGYRVRFACSSPLVSWQFSCRGVCAPEEGCERTNRVLADPALDLLAVPLDVHEARQPQLLEMMRHGRGGQAEIRAQIADAAANVRRLRFTAPGQTVSGQPQKDPQPLWIRKRPELRGVLFDVAFMIRHISNHRPVAATCQGAVLAATARSRNPPRRLLERREAPTPRALPRPQGGLVWFIFGGVWLCRIQRPPVCSSTDANARTRTCSASDDSWARALGRPRDVQRAVPHRHGGGRALFRPSSPFVRTSST
jgi:hypothetical protein